MTQWLQLLIGVALVTLIALWLTHNDRRFAKEDKQRRDLAERRHQELKDALENRQQAILTALQVKEDNEMKTALATEEPNDRPAKITRGGRIDQLQPKQKKQPLTREQELRKAIELVGLLDVRERIKTPEDKAILDKILTEKLQQHASKTDNELHRHGIRF